MITQNGPGPGGTNVGDTLALSQSSTVGTPAVITGNYNIPNVSPMWQAIRAWNGKGGFLLNRDLDPASNDNSPVWLGRVG